MSTYSIDLNTPRKTIYKGHIKMGGVNPKGDRFSFTNYYVEKNGSPFFGICGEFHYSRCLYLNWEQEIQKIKASGINIISTYVFWNHHEEEEGIFVWEGNKNLRYFVDLCAKNNIYVILRIGPFSHGEVKNGGIPDWLYGRPFTIRSNSPEYLFYAKRFYDEIGKQVKGMMFKDNGPVIGIQLENEHMHASPPWEFMATKDFEWLEIGRDGNEHIRALKELAIAAGMEVPIYTCTGWGGASFLEEETLPLYGGYSFCPWVVNEGEVHAPTNEYLIQSFHDNNSSCVEFKPPYQPEKYPYACCELGGGMACWYKYRFVVEPESVEAATIIKIAGGCNFIGYYMFRDGSNPVGKKGFLNERSVPKISYNFQAPLGEYGQIRDSYKMLKPLFYFLKEAQATLCPMGTVLPQEVKNLRPDNNKTLRYAVRHSDSAGFIFLVNYQDHYEMKNIEDIRLKIRTQEEVIAIPRQGRGITLKKNVSAILPFNMKLEGINLRYSTTQFITSIFYQNIRTYFFFEVEGMESEYCFNASDVADIHATGGAINQDRDVIDVFVQPSLESVIEMVSVYGDKVRICTFNRTQAVNFWKFNVWGQDRVIISQEDILFREGQLEVIMDGNKTADLYLYPPVDELLRTEQEVLISERTGIFDTISIASPAKDIKLKVKKFEKNGCNVEFPEDIFSDADDVIMKIDYWGNVGNAFVDGILVSDNFCNGRPWEIGLKWIQANLLKNGMYLHIIPLKKDSEVIFDSSVKFAQHDITHEISEIHSITAIPRYNIKIYMEGTYYEEN